MSSPVKQRQVARILELLEAMKVAGTVKTVERVTRPVTMSPVLPALQLVVGPEDVQADEEDTRGYLIEYVVAITVIDSAAKPEDRLLRIDTLTAAVQVAIEGDIQLACPSGTGLARSVAYQGDDPFYSESEKPLCGNTLTYLIQYRRQRANPSALY